MMTELIDNLRQQGFSERACQFADYIARKERGESVVVSLSAALLSEAMLQGHVCLNLNHLDEIPTHLSDSLPASLDEWRFDLQQSNCVGSPGQYRPLILTDQGLLYLYRYWLDERDVAEAIRQRLYPVKDINFIQLHQDLTEWVNPTEDIDWQKVAVAVALSRHLAVISGGPGTGKTTIVLKILQCLHNQSADLRIGLAAPTGKAAARLQQAISKQQNLEVKTLHRLLGITEHNDQGRYNATRPLPLDVVIIDEASMIDISLMAKLMRAMSAQSRLILLGDNQQLASVESGAVLANLSESEQGKFSQAFITQFSHLGLKPQPADMVPTLMDSFVRLQHSYRFDKNSFIGQLAQRVNQGEVDPSMALLAQQESSWFSPDETSLLKVLAEGYQRFIEAVEKTHPAKETLQAFESFRILAALKLGDQSVASVNRLMQRYLTQRGWRTTQIFYPGRPIMIVQNDYRQHLFNGDVGLILRDDDGKLRACFCFDEELRWVGLNRLPAHETVFAMTVHKSQGSEFDAVSILLPHESTPILNRELLYTAITRAKKTLTILSTEVVLRHTIVTRHERETGLKLQLEQV